MKTTIMTMIILFATLAFGGTTATWTGAGDDNLMSNQANWSGTVDPNGSTIASFASANGEAKADSNFLLFGLNFNSAGYFNLLGDEDAVVAIGEGGIKTSGKGPYALSAPIKIVADQTWDIGVDTTINAPILSEQNSEYKITKSGAGRLEVNAESSFSGDVEIKSGSLFLQGEGSVGSGEITIWEKTNLKLKDATVENAVTIDPHSSWSELTKILIPKENSRSCISGDVTIKMGNFYTEINSPADGECKLVFEGEFKCAGGFDDKKNPAPYGGYPYFRLVGPGSQGSGCAVVEFASPVLLQSRSFYLLASAANKDGIAGTIIFSAKDNVIKSLGHATKDANFRIRLVNLLTTVDDAFNSNSMNFLCDYGMVWDLCGTAQTIGSIDCVYSSPSYRLPRITNSSERPATLSFNQTVDMVNTIVFDGKLNVVMSGTKRFEIQSEMTATGDLTVNGGTLAFSKLGTWRTTPVVTVNEGGKIEIAAGNTFSQELTLSLASPDSFVIAPGEGGAVVTQTVSHLFIGGERQVHGYYQAGSGVLNVLYDDIEEFTDGTLKVEEGDEKRLLPYIKYKFDTIIIGAGAKLEIPNQLCFDADTAYTLIIGEEAVLKLGDGVGLRAQSILYNNKVLSSGRYDCENVSWLEGGSGVYVPSSSEVEGVRVKWTGAGSDTLMSTSGNWEDEVNLANGSLHAVFADGGTRATVPGEVFLNGMTFDYNADFTVDGSDNDALIRLGSGGVSTAGTKAYTVSLPVKIETDQQWEIQTRLTTKLTSDLLSQPTIHKTGTNYLYVLDGASYHGSIDVSKGGVVVYGRDTLGEGGQITVANSNSFTLSGCTVSKPITFLDAPLNNWNDLTRYTVWGDGGDVLQKGHLSFGRGNFYVAMYCKNDYKSTLTFADGFVSESGFPYFDLTGGGSQAEGFCTVVFTNKPLTVTKAFSLFPRSPNRDGIAARFCFAAPGNKMSQLGHDNYCLSSCEVLTTVDWAFDTPNMKVVCDYDTLWDLQGTMQRVGHLDARHTQNRAPVITNSFDRPATLHLNQNAVSTPRAVFGGNLSVDISGNSDTITTIDHPMTATGSLTVNNGTLAFTPAGSWSKASAVVVNGNAKLILGGSENLGRKTHLSLAAENSLEIAAGVSLRVASLSVNGVERPLGSYRFGDGELAVGPRGFKMIIR